MASRPWLSALTLAGALALGLGGCGSTGGDRGGASRDRPVTLLLDFQPNAVHAGIYETVAKDYDGAAGVALHVRIPGDSTDAVKLLVAGRTDLAVLDIHDLAIARERGRDIVGVMALVQRPLAAVLAQPQVRTPRELEGKRVGVTGLPSDDAVLRSIVAGAGGNPKRVRPVTIGFDAVRSLLTGRVAGATAFWDVEGVALRARRPRIREFRVDDYGAPPYPELVLTVTRRTLQRKPHVVGDAVRALVRGYGSVIDDPQAAISTLLAHTDGLSRSTLTRQLDAVLPAFGAGAHDYGELDPRRLNAWARWERRFGIVRRAPDVARAFDGRFVTASTSTPDG
jgi:putative hydroxymethylpyrimidine transport system substrate-binding protein